MSNIIFDAAANAGDQHAVTSFSFSHTVGSGQNGILIVGTGVNQGLSGENDVTGITYGGTPLTNKVRLFDINSNESTCELWYLVNPPAGAANVVVTYSQSINHGTASSLSYFHVNPSHPINIFGSNAVNAATNTLTVTTTIKNCMIVDLFWDYSRQSISSLGAGQTQRVSYDPGSAYIVGMSEKMASGKGANSTSWTISAIQETMLLSIALTPLQSFFGGML